MKRKSITPAESKTAFEAQAPTFASKKRGRKPALPVPEPAKKTRGRKPASTVSITPSIISFADLKSKLNEGLYEDEPTLDWCKASDLVGTPFNIQRAVSFESKYGSRIGYQIEILDDDFVETVGYKICMISLPWSKSRHREVTVIRDLLRSAGKGSVAGPLTFEAIDTGQANPYIALVGFHS